MKYSGFPTVNRLSPLRRFMMTILLDPVKIVIFYCIVGILLFATMAGGFLALFVHKQRQQNADIGSAALQTGTATVEVLRYRTTKGPSPYADAQIGLRINGRLAIVNAPNDERTARLHQNDILRVNYRVGKSGAIYVENWQPSTQ